MRKSAVPALVLTALAILLAGCSDGREISTPPACLTDPAHWVTALSKAPDPVLIEESTPISDCLPEDQAASQQQEVGKTAVEVATQLAAFYKGPHAAAGAEGTSSAGQAGLMAGYLVGALETAANETGGIHTALVDRVQAAATNGLDGAGQELQGEYQRGHEAGLESG